MPQTGKKQLDERVLLSLACGATVEAAAQSAGVGESTVYRRLQDPEFKRRLQEMRAQMVQRTAAALTAASTEAVKTLLALQKETQPAPVRLGAARAVLEIGVKLREAAEIEERVAALEAQLQAAG